MRHQLFGTCMGRDPRAIDARANVTIYNAYATSTPNLMHLPIRSEFAAYADIASVTSRALDEALKVMATQLGNLQLADWELAEPLEIVEQRGFGEEFLDCFRRISLSDPSACGRALLHRTTVVIDDVMMDEEFAPFREVALRAGFRSVQSTPLLSSTGVVIGVLSTHDPQPGRPSEDQLAALREIARSAADAILRLRVLKRIAHPPEIGPAPIG